MPRLYPEPFPGSTTDPGRRKLAYFDPLKTGTQFWDALRLRLSLLIGPDSGDSGRHRPPFQSILDTGAPLTLFPDEVWSGFPTKYIQFLDGPPTIGAMGLTVAGLRCRFRLGWIWLGVVDDELPAGRLPAQRVLAQFAEDNGRLKQNVLVGLSHSVLTGRRLVRETTLEADEPEPSDPARRRPTYGQIWRLTAV